MAVLFHWRKIADDPEGVRQWLLHSWVSICFSQRLFLNACTHHCNLAYKMLAACHGATRKCNVQFERSKVCNYSAYVSLPVLFGVCAGIIEIIFGTVRFGILSWKKGTRRAEWVSRGSELRARGSELGARGADGTLALQPVLKPPVAGSRCP